MTEIAIENLALQRAVLEMKLSLAEVVDEMLHIENKEKATRERATSLSQQLDSFKLAFEAIVGYSSEAEKIVNSLSLSHQQHLSLTTFLQRHAPFLSEHMVDHNRLGTTVGSQLRSIAQLAQSVADAQSTIFQQSNQIQGLQDLLGVMTQKQLLHAQRHPGSTRTAITATDSKTMLEEYQSRTQTVEQLREAGAQVLSLTRERDQLRTMLQETQTQLSDYSSRLLASETEKTQLQGTLRERMKVQTDLSEHVDRERHTRESLSTALEMKQKEIERCRHDLSTISAELSTKRKEVNEHVPQIAGLTARAEKAEMSNTELSKRLLEVDDTIQQKDAIVQQKDATIRQLETSLSSSREESVRIREELTKSEQALQNTMNDLRMLNESLGKIREERDKLALGYEALRTRQSESSEEVRDQLRQANQFRTEVAELHRLCASVTSEKDAIESQFVELQTSNDRLQAAYDDVVSKLSAVASESAALDERIQTLEKENTALRESQDTESLRLQRRLKECEDNLTSMQSQLSQKDHTIDALRQELRSLKQKDQQLVSQITEAQMTLEESQRMFDTAKGELETLRGSMMSESRDQLEIQEQTIVELTNQLQIARRDLHRYQMQNLELTADNETSVLRSQLELTQALIIDENSQIHALSVELAAARTQAEEYRLQLNDCFSELRMKQAKLLEKENQLEHERTAHRKQAELEINHQRNLESVIDRLKKELLSKTAR